MQTQRTLQTRTKDDTSPQVHARGIGHMVHVHVLVLAHVHVCVWIRICQTQTTGHAKTTISQRLKMTRESASRETAGLSHNKQQYATDRPTEALRKESHAGPAGHEPQYKRRSARIPRRLGDDTHEQELGCSRPCVATLKRSFESLHTPFPIPQRALRARHTVQGT